MHRIFLALGLLLPFAPLAWAETEESQRRDRPKGPPPGPRGPLGLLAERERIPQGLLTEEQADLIRSALRQAHENPAVQAAVQNARQAGETFRQTLLAVAQEIDPDVAQQMDRLHRPLGFGPLHEKRKRSERSGPPSPPSGRPPLPEEANSERPLPPGSPGLWKIRQLMKQVRADERTVEAQAAMKSSFERYQETLKETVQAQNPEAAEIMASVRESVRSQRKRERRDPPSERPRLRGPEDRP
ncbi:MAG: hypothetical protein AAF555_05590 [Verrucomicrobiota bacterium]